MWWDVAKAAAPESLAFSAFLIPLAKLRRLSDALAVFLMHRRAGFTLLELCVAIVIALTVLGIAVPSVRSVMAEQRLKATFEEFDDFVRKAQLRSVAERTAVRLVWGKEGIELVPERAAREGEEPKIEQFPFSEGRAYVLSRPAALAKDAAAEWPFWRSGTCEPVVVDFQGPEGRWTVRYDALTTQGTFLDSSLP